ncbi:MAG: sulfotransferase domain-containing protein [Thermoplasmata archaeon]|jgi:LPS sulfotransferase NodH|nr:MAG: sulfotransferase domain-containing protein [Thermoplasmata archaeon]
MDSECQTLLGSLKNKIWMKTHILIACFQKSGSTYFANLLRMLTGFRGAGLTQYYGNNEQDLYEYKLKKHAKHNTVSCHHVKGTENNIDLMKKYGIKPIVHTRNIFDVVVSLKDHMETQGHQTPTGYIHKQYFNMSDEDKLMYLIRVHLPWYFSFLVSWSEASEDIEVLSTSYEELFNDQIGTVAKILNFYDLPFPTEKIKQSINRVKTTNTRFSVGIKGRGKQLSQKHKDAIYDLAEAWKIENSLLNKIGIEF